MPKESKGSLNDRSIWIDPSITELQVEETNAFIGRGADIGGNPTIDCQRS